MLKFITREKISFNVFLEKSSIFAKREQIRNQRQTRNICCDTKAASPKNINKVNFYCIHVQNFYYLWNVYQYSPVMSFLESGSWRKVNIEIMSGTANKHYCLIYTTSRELTPLENIALRRILQHFTPQLCLHVFPATTYGVTPKILFSSCIIEKGIDRVSINEIYLT